MIALALAALLAAPTARKLGPPTLKPDAGEAPAAAPQEQEKAPSVQPAVRPDTPQLRPGDRAPLFSLPLHNPGEAGQGSLDLATLVGPSGGDGSAAQTLLLGFFARRCKPCRRELKILQGLWVEYRDRGLRVVLVATDQDASAGPALRKFAARHRITVPILDDRHRLAARRYLVDEARLPALFLIGHDGRLVLASQGRGSGALLSRTQADLAAAAAAAEPGTGPEPGPR